MDQNFKKRAKSPLKKSEKSPKNRYGNFYGKVAFSIADEASEVSFLTLLERNLNDFKALILNGLSPFTQIFWIFLMKLAK